VHDNNSTLREATIDDLDAVLGLDRLSPVAHPRVAFLTRRVQSRECHVFEREGVVVGYITLRSKTFIGRDFVDLLAVSPDAQRQGIATALLHYVLAISSTPQTFTSTNKSNLAMIRLLEKDGWSFSGRLEGIDEGDPEFVYYTNSV
jgi:ribosomal protein S18 acetylase RimI-like enzyme